MDLQSTPLATAGRAATSGAPRKHTARPVPEKSEDHAHLSLDELRGYRKTLADEESRVSYWRRILQARLDLVRAGADADSDTLRPVLTDRRVGAGRQALVEIMPVDDIPPLPDLAELWGRIVDLDDTAALAGLETDLAAAEQQLSEYRTVLHHRINAATGELIARYREQPSLCLSALPLHPTRRVASA